MTLRFYVAGKAGKGENDARSAANLLQRRGWHWTMDWTTAAVNKPYLSDPERNSHAARAMLDAVRTSDLVVLCADDSMFGALVEVGAALGAGAAVAVLGSCRESVFWCLPNVRLVDDLDSLDRLAAELEAGR